MAYTRQQTFHFEFPQGWTQRIGIAAAVQNRLFLVGTDSSGDTDHLFVYNWQGERIESEEFDMPGGTLGLGKVVYQAGEVWVLQFRINENRKPPFYYTNHPDNPLYTDGILTGVLRDGKSVGGEVEVGQWGEASIVVPYDADRVLNVGGGSDDWYYARTNYDRAFRRYTFGGTDTFGHIWQDSGELAPVLVTRTPFGILVSPSLTDKTQMHAYGMRDYGNDTNYYANVRLPHNDIAFSVNSGYTGTAASAVSFSGLTLLVQFPNRLEIWRESSSGGGTDLLNIGSGIVNVPVSKPVVTPEPTDPVIIQPTPVPNVPATPENPVVVTQPDAGYISDQRQVTFGRTQYRSFGSTVWTAVRVDSNYDVIQIVEYGFDALYTVSYNEFAYSADADVQVLFVPRVSLYLDESMYLIPNALPANELAKLPQVSWKVRRMMSGIGYQYCILTREIIPQ